jgi:hypothetical protein
LDTVIPKRKRGRPPGSRNKPQTTNPVRLTPPSADPGADYRYADPETIIARQLSMLDWAQQACRNEMQRAMQGKGLHIDVRDIEKLEKLSNAIVRAVDALKKSADLADELSKRLTPEQLLEAALKKVEGQDAATIRYAIKRLRAYLEKLGPITGGDKTQLGESGFGARATDAIRALED